jgi:uncharacterized protein with HEPN domain
MSKRSPQLLLEDILESCQRILAYTKELDFNSFVSDSKTVDAVIRNFEIIGEAANLLPDNVKEEYNSVDWIRIRGFRNRVVHHYFGVDMEIVWRIIEENIPRLSNDIENILRKI